MPITPFHQAKIAADEKVRRFKAPHIWGETLFKELRRVLAGKSQHEINAALDSARDIIELRSLQIPHDRVILLQQLTKLREDLKIKDVTNVAKE